MGCVTTFDRLFDEAAPLIQQGLHQRDTPPIEGGRWPVSVVLRPDQASAERLEQVMGEVEAIELELVGMTLTPGTVMVCAHPVDDSASRFMHLLKEQLGADAWYEAGFRRDIWYANLLHFAADIAQPAGLIEWVEACRQLDLGRMVLDTAELWRFHYEDGTDGRVMRPAVLARTRMGSPGTVTANPWR